MNALSVTSIAVLAASSLLCSLQAGAAVPALDSRGLPAITSCPATSTVPLVFHSDKIVFTINGLLTAVLVNDQAKLDALPRGAPLDIKVRDNPVMIANLKGKVLSFLGAKSDIENAQAINITQVLYATAVCYPKAW